MTRGQRWRSRRQLSFGRGESGATLVEFAFVLPVLAMLVFGILTGGSAYEQKLAITHASREGARYGSTLALDQTFVSGTWATNIQQLIISRASGDLAATGSSVCVSLVEGSSGAGAGVIVVSPSSDPATPDPQANYTTNQGAGGTNPTPCDTSETYPTSATDHGRRVQVRVSRPGRIQAVAFTMNLTLSGNATARYEGTTTS